MLVSSGCARIGTRTDVKPDGSFVRTVVYRGSAPSTDGFSMAPALDDLIAPPRTPGWKVTRETDPKSENKSELIVTATRAFPAGETLSDDLALKSPPKKDAPKGTPPTMILGNTLSVRTLPDGKLEYREVIRWRGPKPTELATPDSELMTLLAATLPTLDKAGQATLTLHLQQSLWRALFGPGEPLLGLLITHPELGEFKLKRHLGASVDTELKGALGEKLSEPERRTAVQKIVAAITNDVKDKTKKQANAGPGGDKNDDALVAMLIKAKLPGKLLQTNGEEDPATGEIVWGFFSQAAAAGDVVLTAICDPGK
ncbi:hypothetical protein [Armatimonas sp.]|uniref:hypothetical protein n=1 Tax=Armatimonas sp. TaxID=1872638 RepID=UPI00286A4768|nr:hypothetical protein [Armatimonas sp.]